MSWECFGSESQTAENDPLLKRLLAMPSPCLQEEQMVAFITAHIKESGAWPRKGAYGPTRGSSNPLKSIKSYGQISELRAIAHLSD